MSQMDKMHFFTTTVWMLTNFLMWYVMMIANMVPKYYKVMSCCVKWENYLYKSIKETEYLLKMMKMLFFNWMGQMVKMMKLNMMMKYVKHNMEGSMKKNYYMDMKEDKEDSMSSMLLGKWEKMLSMLWPKSSNKSYSTMNNNNMSNKWVKNEESLKMMMGKMDKKVMENNEFIKFLMQEKFMDEWKFKKMMDHPTMNFFHKWSFDKDSVLWGFSNLTVNKSFTDDYGSNPMKFDNEGGSKMLEGALMLPFPMDQLKKMIMEEEGWKEVENFVKLPWDSEEYYMKMNEYWKKLMEKGELEMWELEVKKKKYMMKLEKKEEMKLMECYVMNESDSDMKMKDEMMSNYMENPGDCLEMPSLPNSERMMNSWKEKMNEESGSSFND